jgi:hypothetical protein
MGARFEWDDKAIRRLTEDAVRATQEDIRRAVSRVVCPDHGERVQWVTEKGKTPDRLDRFGSVHACCDKAVALAERATNRVLR